MSQFPAKTCQIDRLIRHPKLVAAALAGEKTQQRRDGLYAYPGENFFLETTEFTITHVARQRIGDMTEADAHAEGYADLASYKTLILSMHQNMNWNEDGWVWVHSFQRVSDPQSA